MHRVTLVVLASLVLALAGGAVRAGDDFAGKKLVRRDFRGQDLAGAKFDGADLTSADLSGANLKGATFVDANLTQTKLDGADCTGADFTDAKFDTTMARETNFSKAKLEGADVGGYTVFRGSNFRGANLRKFRGLTDATQCDFSGADLRGANLKNAADWKAPSIQWTKATYDDATKFPKDVDPAAVGAIKATDAAPAPAPTPPPAGMNGLSTGPTSPAPAGGAGGKLGGGLGGGLDAPVEPATGTPAAGPTAKAVGTGKDASGQDWRGRDLKGEKFDDVNLSKATLISTQFQDASLRFADLNGADLWGARLDGADMTGCDLRTANLKDAHLWGTNLAGANLEGQDLSVLWGLSETSFKGANLRNLKGGLHVTVSKCDFRKADVRGAHLAGPGTGYFQTCDFRGAIFDETTRWPKGFDVEGSGAIRVAGAAAPGDEEEPPPDRLLAPDRDPDAPSEAIVKKVFRESVADLAGAIILAYGKGGKEGSPPVSVANRYSVEYTKLTYLPSETVTLHADSGSTFKAYPIDIEANLTSEGKDGSERTDPIHWTVRFYKTDNGIWKCVQPEAKHVKSK